MGRKRRRPSPPQSAPAPLTAKTILAKAKTMTGNSVDEASAVKEIEAQEQMFGQCGAVIPDYDPESMLTFIELSPHLSPNIAAYVQNIEGYGHQAVVEEAWMDDLTTEEAHDAVQQAIIIEEWADQEEEALADMEEKAELKRELEGILAKHADAVKMRRTTATIKKWKKKADEVRARLDDIDPEAPAEDTVPVEDPLFDETVDEDAVDDAAVDAAVDAELKKLDIQIRREQYMYDSFFKHCCSESSFVKLKRIVRQDIESHGWGCIEMQRDKYNRLKRLTYIPAYTMRPLVSEGELVEVIEDDSITPLSEDREIVVNRRFKIYVQIVQDKKVYFKSPGDPRVVSRKTGKTYETVQEMRKTDNEGKGAVEANEILWIALHSPKTPCPPPRWIGNLLQVLGGREADETNYYYLRNDAIPYGLMFVSGGTIPNDIKERIESRLASEMRGSEGSGKILVVQATPMGKTSADGPVILPQMEFKSLREAHQQDGLFIKYDERGSDRIGASFRLPPMLRGYTPSNLNRATAIASITFAESQVFQPERDDMDWVFNKWVLPDIGIRYLKMVSNSPPTRGVDEMTEIIKAAAPNGGLIPAEIRQMISEMLNKPMAKIKEEWTKQPMVMTLSGINGEGGIPTDDAAGEMTGQLGELVKRLTEIDSRVRSVVVEELAAIGMDVDVNTSFFDRNEQEGEEGDESTG